MSATSVVPEVEKILDRATYEARKLKARAVEPLHLFVALCKLEPERVIEALRAEGLDPVTLRRYARGYVQQQNRDIGDLERVSQRVRSILSHAKRHADGRLRAITPVDVALAMFEKPDTALQNYFVMQQVPIDALRRRLSDGEPIDVGGESPDKSAPPEGSRRRATPLLDQLGRDLSALARAKALGPFVGRQNELGQMMRTLLRHEKRNVLLIGDAGVGKTALVEALAVECSKPDAPAEIGGFRIVELSMTSFFADAKFRGEVEARLQRLFAELEADPNIVLFIDELHALVERRGSDLANQWKPVLARSPFRIIGATTRRDYDDHLEKDGGLVRRFQPLFLDEPSPEETRAILAALRPPLEVHHGISISDAAIDAAVALSVRYLPERRLPDKARDVLDQAAVDLRFRSLGRDVAKTPLPQLMADGIASVIASWAKLPLEKIAGDDMRRLLDLEARLSERVMGQTEAISRVARVVRTGLAGLSRPQRPYGVFLFVGPTGVGKTELAKALAAALFGSDRALLRFDMSEYHDEHTVQKLIGSPPGYVGHDDGGQLTNAIRNRPHAVVLFDEVEKAHPRVADVFLQIFDDGRLTDGQGRTVDFSHTVVVVTSNLVSSLKPKRSIGLVQDSLPSSDELRAQLARWFRIELLNRMSDIVLFQPLAPEDIRRIIDKALANVRERLAPRSVGLELDEAAYAQLAEDGFDEQFGARELERVIERRVVQPIADRLLAGEVPDHSRIRVSGVAGGIAIVVLGATD